MTQENGKPEAENYGEPQQYPAAPPGSRWPRYLSFLRRLWWVPVLTMSLGLCGGVLYSVFRQADYAFSSRIWVGGKLTVPEGSLYVEELAFFFGTQIQLLKSENNRQRALDHVQLLHPEMNPCFVRLDIKQSPKSAVLDVTATGKDPAYTQAYLDALVDEYFKYKKEMRATTSDDTLTSLATQVHQQEQALQAEQEKLAGFQKENNLAVLQEQGVAAGSYLSKLTAQRSDSMLEYQLLESASLEQRTDDDDPLKTTASSTGPPTEYQEARQHIKILKIQREELSRDLLPKHPKLQKLEEDIERAQKVIDLYRQRNKEQVSTAKQALKTRIQNLETPIKEWETKLMESNRRVAEFDRLKANIQRTQSLYDRLLNLLQTVDVHKNIEQETMSVMQRASAAKLTRIAKPWELALAALAGLVAGLGLVYLVTGWDDRFTSINDLVEQFEEEVVGQVPDISKTKTNGKLQLLEADDPRHIFAESFRNIRSSVLFMPTIGARPKALLVTSSAMGEGKSTIAANLARTMAFAGARVLLVDADLRLGKLHELFGIDRDRGLARLLQEQGSLDAFIHPTSLPNLSFIPSGKPINNSGDLFLGSTFERLLQQMQQQFDQIIIDSPPVFAADDATTLAPKLDGVLYVVRGSYTSARMARKGIDLLYQRQAKVLGLVFNRSNSKSASYYYYKYDEYAKATKAG